MDFQEEVLPLAVVLLIAAAIKKKRKLRKKRNRTCWVKDWIARREERGCAPLLLELRDYAEDVRHFLRMDEESYVILEELVGPLICRQDTWLRNSIPVRDRLLATLRYLASGEDYKDLAYLTRISESSLSIIIPETCRAIYKVLKGQYLRVPNTEEEWLDVAKEYYNRWNVPNALGALDGKHVRIKPPKKAGSRNFCYKGYNSIVLLALGGADYRLLYVDVGTNGKVGDGGTYQKSTLRKCLLDRSILNMPTEAVLPLTDIKLPMFVLADDAFPLSPNAMKPFPMTGITKAERIFNYRLSRARRMIETIFGILANRFKILLKTIRLEPDKVVSIVLAICALHNFLLGTMASTYSSHRLAKDLDGHLVERATDDYDETAEMISFSLQKDFTQWAITGNEVRNTLKDFFNGIGSVSWQDGKV